MHPAVLRTCSAFVILSFAIFRPIEIQSQHNEPAEARVWLAVEEHARGQLIIEPVATVEDSILTPIQTGCLSDAQNPDDFAAEYLQSGRKYSVLFGGASVGEAQVGEPNRSASTASLIYSGSLKIRGQVHALATNAEPGDFRVPSREPATAEQRASALELARELFSQHGVPEAVLSKVRAEYVTRTYLAPSPQPSLVGSFLLDTDDAEGLAHHMFFIASQPGEKLQPDLLWIHISESETDEESLRLVDHADLLGNGQDEVVAKLISLQTQTHRYVIFRRTKNGAHWEQVFKTEPLGCSS
jgi:hypothetical protein